MRWLLIVGLALDGVGAMLISWPLIHSPPEAREGSIQRWGGNPWGLVTRTREVHFVQVGALFLVFGFLLQAVSYVREFGSWLEAVGVIVATVLLGLAAGTRLAGRGLPRYAIPEDAAITDQRHAYNVATVMDYRALLAAYVRERHGHPPTRSDKREVAVIRSGQWRARCPECPHTPVAAWPENPDAICTDGGHVFAVDFPPEAERRRIEERLASLPLDERDWDPGSSEESEGRGEPPKAR
jgi:hypothetical protein